MKVFEKLRNASEIKIKVLDRRNPHEKPGSTEK